MTDVLNGALRSVERWASLWRVTFSVEKCTWTYFNKHLLAAQHLPQPPKMSGTPLKLTLHPRYLGVTFDPRLKWERHIANVNASATRKLNLMRRVQQVGRHTPSWDHYVQMLAPRIT